MAAAPHSETTPPGDIRPDPVPATALAAAGIAADDVAALASTARGATFDGPFPAAVTALGELAGRADHVLGLLGRAGDDHDRAVHGRAARGAVSAAITNAVSAARDRFLAAQAAPLYEELTDGRTTHRRIEDLCEKAAQAVPGLLPSSAELEVERSRPLAEKVGLELPQGLLLSHFLALPAAGLHLLEAMLRPLPAALELLPQLRRDGEVDLGPVHVSRHGDVGFLELRNPRHLNAEDETTLTATECGVDLLLLDESVEVCVIRGGRVDRPGYANDRVFGSGINLTHLYLGRIDFLFYLVRDLGYVNKIYRGLSATSTEPVEKLWIAAVESFAIGGACQLLHVVDHVIATRGARLFLPARKEGIIPGASNLRLPRFVGDRAARQAILSGREWRAGDPDADALCDEVVEPGDMERALAARADALTSSGLVNAAANRRALRNGAEPIDTFRQYMASYARDQALCHLSPALVRNLEVHWKAHERRT